MNQEAKDSMQEKKRENFVLRCSSCGEKYAIDEYGSFYFCKKCGDLLEIKLLDATRSRNRTSISSGVWKYLDLVPLWNESNIVSLSEGDTVLVECRNLAREFGIKSLYVKFEGQNPTGSFKDRGMTVGVSKAVEQGYKTVMCASTGNTSASLAAYSAHSGKLRCVVLIPKGKIAVGKIAQAIAYGAEIIQVEGNFDDSLHVATKVCEENRNVLLLNSLNPFRIEGQKTLAFEIEEQLSGIVPDYVILPVGNGGNISSIWKGFGELLGKKSERRPPKMVAVQAEGAAPIVNAFKQGNRDSIDMIREPHTDASAINIGSPVSWKKALRAIYESDGLAEAVSDAEIFSAQKLLASKEGIFAEPASATPIAYLSSKLSMNPKVREEMRDSTVICIATGNGLKDPNAILKGITPEKFLTIEPDQRSLEMVLS